MDWCAWEPHSSSEDREMNLRTHWVFSICSICYKFLWLHMSASGFGHCPASSWTSRAMERMKQLQECLRTGLYVWCGRWEKASRSPNRFLWKPQGFSALTVSCLWLFAADPPSKENPYEDIETNSRCLGKKCVLTFPASPTSSVPGTPTKVLWFKWPSLLLQKVFWWNPNSVGESGVLPIWLSSCQVFFCFVFYHWSQYGAIRGDLLPFSKVKISIPLYKRFVGFHCFSHQGYLPLVEGKTFC